MSKEDYSLLGENSIDKNNDGMRERTAGGQMGMAWERLRRGSVRPSKGLNKFDEREVADGLGPDDSRNFDRNWNVMIDHL